MPGEHHTISRNPAEKARQLRSFVPTAIFYFVFTFVTSLEGLSFPLWGVLIAKVLPILVLIRFVVRQHAGSFTSMWECEFSRFVFLGLCFSLLGDSLLVYQGVSNKFFMSGLIAFAIGHGLYIFAFGWTPFAFVVLAKMSLVATALYWFLWQGGLKELSLVLQIGVAIYAGLNGGMNWRSWARLSLQDFKDGRWYEFLGCIGALNFLVSDAILAINKFVSPVPYENYLIMGTYYVAQLGITLSVVDGPDKYARKEKTT